MTENGWVASTLFLTFTRESESQTQPQDVEGLRLSPYRLRRKSLLYLTPVPLVHQDPWMTHLDFPPGVLFQEIKSIQATEITFSYWLRPSPASNSNGNPIDTLPQKPHRRVVGTWPNPMLD